MVTTKKPAKKPATRKVATKADAKPMKKVPEGKASIIETKMMKVSELHPYHKNPRIGDVGLIAESLEANGQFAPIIVNIGSMTDHKFEILAGNHTWLGARHLGWKEILVSLVDVSADRAKRIVLAANKTADSGSYDTDMLAELIAGLPDISGTGFDEDEFKELTKFMDKAVIKAERDTQIAMDDLNEQTHNGFVMPGQAPSDDNDYDNTDLEGTSSSIAGGFDLKIGLDETDKSIRAGYWGIPKLRSDMLMTYDELPENIRAWAGSATKDWPDDEQWWFYNWGIDSTSGMKDVSKVVVGFFTYDNYFEDWFYNPSKYLAKLLNSGIKYAVVPNYSQWSDEPHTLNLWALYRSRYVGRYMQDAGIKVIPDVVWPMNDRDFLENHVLKTLPANLPMIAIQINTFDKKTVLKTQKEVKACFNMILDTLKPEGLLVYGSRSAFSWLRGAVKLPDKTKFIETRLKMLGEQAAKRGKKLTI